MRPILHITATGKGFLTLLAVTVAVLALVGLIFGPMPALAAGISLIVLIRGVLAIFRPSEPSD